MRSWEGNYFTAMDEAREMVDMLLDELGWGVTQRAAIDRQAAIYATLDKMTI